MRKRYYIGHCAGTRTLFLADKTPTEASHGHLYKAVIGPFRTKRAAIFMTRYGWNNPHCLAVADAEKLAKRYYDAKSGLFSFA